MIVGVVVLYNPEVNDVKKNIKTYEEHLDHLLIIDNSERVNQSFADYLNLYYNYEFLGENKGIAYALNRGIEFAKEHNANWLLTMDQDSSFESGEFQKFTYFVKQDAKKYKDAVIFSPVHKVPYLFDEKGIKKVDSVMTSGNLLNIDLIDKVGYFDEDLFIDSVDHEYCFRIKSKGYSVYRNSNIFLKHNLGEITTKKFLNKTLYVTNHNYIRRYYITRNLLYVMQKYSSQLGFMKFLINHLFWTIFTISFYEKSKILKYKSVFMGLIDFKRGRYGKKIF